MTTTDTTTSRSFSVPEFTMGDRIRRARMNAGLKQQDIEDETGISRNSVTAWEHDARMPSAALLRVLANYLRVPVEWITRAPHLLTHLRWRIGRQLYDRACRICPW